MPELESARLGRDGADGFQPRSHRREGMCTSSEARALAMAFATFARLQFFIRTDGRGYIEVGDQCRTSAAGVWAVSADCSCTLKPAIGLVISWPIV